MNISSVYKKYLKFAEKRVMSRRALRAKNIKIGIDHLNFGEQLLKVIHTKVENYSHSLGHLVHLAYHTIIMRLDI